MKNKSVKLPFETNKYKCYMYIYLQQKLVSPQGNILAGCSDFCSYIAFPQ